MTRLIVISVGVFILILIIIWLLPFGVINAGYRGVVFNNFSGLEKGRILPEGTYWRTPFAEHVIEMPVRVQKTDFPNESAGANDTQTVIADLTVNWHLDPGKVDQIYDQVGANLDTIESTVFANNVREAMKASVSQYEAIKVLPNRDKIVSITTDSLQNKVKKYHIIIDGVSFNNVHFSSDFEAAVERAKVAQQDAVAAQNKVQQANAERDQKIAQAQGDAESQRLQQQTLTPEYLQKIAVDKWDGHFPQYFLGGNTLPFLNIPSK